MYACIADVVSVEDRSYRMSLLPIVSSTASLATIVPAGYILKYVRDGFAYLFTLNSALLALTLVYAGRLIDEPLVELRDRSLWQRIRSCSFNNLLNSFRVFFKTTTTTTTTSNDETQIIDQQGSQLKSSSSSSSSSSSKSKSNTLVLLLILAAAACQTFGGACQSSIQTLFLINYPMCFDSVSRSNLSLFGQVTSIVLGFLACKYVRINDLLFCLMCVTSAFVGQFFRMFGTRQLHMYMESAFSAIADMQNDYAKSAITKYMSNKADVGHVIASGECTQHNTTNYNQVDEDF